MQTTVALDERLLEKAQKFTGLMEKSEIVNEGLRALVERESARALAQRGGTMPELNAVPRRRSAR